LNEFYIIHEQVRILKHARPLQRPSDNERMSAILNAKDKMAILFASVLTNY